MSDCQWSGGFSLDRDTSFNVQMRGRFGHSVFVRCEIILISATFHVVLSDAANYPPPFRLENLSQVPVLYHQAKTATICTLNPGQSIPYAWDESMLAEVMCLQVKGVEEIKEFDFNIFGTRGNLYYESYFYISATGTLDKDESMSLDQASETISNLSHRKISQDKELVLGVPQGSAVIFQRKARTNFSFCTN